MCLQTTKQPLDEHMYCTHIKRHACAPIAVEGLRWYAIIASPHF